MKVRDVMQRDVVIVAPSDSVQCVSQLMQEKNVGSAIVADDGHLQGIVTDRDIVVRCVAKGFDPAACRVAEIMSGGNPPTTIAYVSPETDMLDAALILGRRHIRRLPVIEDGRVVGIVSLVDLAKEAKAYTDGVLEALSQRGPVIQAIQHAA